MRKCHELKITNHCAVTAPKNTQWEAEMKKMGVLGLIKRDSSLKDFERALVSILNGISVWPDLHKVLSKSSCTSYLTRRQEDVLCLLHRGYTSKKIAAQLGLSSGTVNNHVMSLVRSLNATGRTHAVAKAIEFGYIEI
jgi:DNA-binding NarL/FixJ family response regulator